VRERRIVFDAFSDSEPVERAYRMGMIWQERHVWSRSIQPSVKIIVLCFR